MVSIPGLWHLEQCKELGKKHTRSVTPEWGQSTPHCQDDGGPTRCPPPSPLFTVKLLHKMLLSVAVTVNAAVAVDFHSPRKSYPRQGGFNRETQTTTCFSSESRRYAKEREMSHPWAGARRPPSPTLWAGRTIMKSAGPVGEIPEQNVKQFVH